MDQNQKLLVSINLLQDCLLEIDVFWLQKKLIIETERCQLRIPVISDYENWVLLRRKSEKFLSPWEPKREKNFYLKSTFKARVNWSRISLKEKRALSVFIFRKADAALMGAITLDNIRRGSAQTGTIGYWIGVSFIRQGYMSEALNAIKFQAFNKFDLSRLEAATLPENLASRKLLEKTGFKYEGVAQSFLQISGRWRNHVLYSLLRTDRRGKGSSVTDY